MPRMIRYTILIEETIGRSGGNDRNENKNYPVWTRELKLPVDSKGKHVFKQINRSTMDLLYLLADHGYLNVVRGIGDLLTYDSIPDEEEEK